MQYLQTHNIKVSHVDFDQIEDQLKTEHQVDGFVASIWKQARQIAYDQVNTLI